MSLPYFPMYPTDFEAKTSHLTLEEDGAYNRLLRLMWMTPGCSLPDDDTWIMRRMRCDLETFERVVKPLICEFMKREKGRVFSPRLMQEHMLSSEKHKKRVDAGKKGGRPAKPLKSNETRQSNAKAMPKQPEPEPDIDTNVSMEEGAREKPIPLPVDWKPRPEEIAICKELNFTQQEIADVVDDFRNFWPGEAKTKRGKKTIANWHRTFRNSVRASAQRWGTAKRKAGADGGGAQSMAATGLRLIRELESEDVFSTGGQELLDTNGGDDWGFGASEGRGSGGSCGIIEAGSAGRSGEGIDGGGGDYSSKGGRRPG
jgi:uncharacterized protein YdaU (DUF1376 family)